MRSCTRGMLAAVIATAAVLNLSVAAVAAKPKPTPSPSPSASPSGIDAPSQAAVDKAKAKVAAKTRDVAAIQAALAVAEASSDAAAEHAGKAAAAYNRALWRLKQAQAATDQARKQAAAMRANVEANRAGVAQLVTQSYGDAAPLGGVSAIVEADGPEGVMERLGAVSSAMDSLQAKYDEYRALTVVADLAEKAATKAERKQKELAHEADKLREESLDAALAAQAAASRIAGQRHALLEELAAAQKVSIELAGTRQKALEKAAEEARERAAAARAKKDLASQVQQHQLTLDQLASSRPEGGWEFTGLPVPKGTPAAAKNAVKYALAQVGKPYVWAAAGPNAFDCSGLTMRAWQAAGVQLPHYSAAQYMSYTTHINVDELLPGDLLFWGTSPNTIHHVAMFIGGDRMVQAPKPGSYVEVVDMRTLQDPPKFFGRP